MKKALLLNLPLIIWFIFNMTGLTISGNILVTQSYKEDGLFFLIYIATLLLFVFFNKIGKYILSGWLFLWFSLQLYLHWYFTIFGPWEGSVKYFANTYKLFPSTERYIPDFYHIILHILILIALVGTVNYCFKTRKKPAAE